MTDANSIESWRQVTLEWKDLYQEQKVMQAIAINGGGVARQIQKWSHVELVSCRRALHDLEEKGLIESRDVYYQPTNRTVKLFTLTEEGRKMVKGENLA